MTIAANVTALATARDNIRTAINAKGGTLTAADGFGDFAAAIAALETGGGGGTDFYKCASVDTTNHTWTGYKAVANEVGGYDFESTATTGLTYTAQTPTVNNIYTADALIKAASVYTGRIPADGLIFYASFSSVYSPAETAQVMEVNGTAPVILTESGITGAQFTHSSDHLTTTVAGAAPATCSMAFWFKSTALSGDHPVCVFGDSGWNSGLFLWQSSQTLHFFTSGWGTIADSTAALNGAWHHCAIVSGESCTAYLDGVQIGTTTTGTIGSGFLSISGNRNGGGTGVDMFAAFRIYNRALSAAEIALLAAEFTPTA